MLRALVVAALLPLGGCPEEDPGVPCTKIACDGGFDLWLTSTNDNSVYDPGRYVTVIELGDHGVDGEVVLVCTVDNAGKGSCDPPDWKTPSADGVTVTVQFGIPPAQGAIDTPAIQIHLEGRSDAPAGQNVFGPEWFELVVERDTRKVGEEVFMPDYERDEEFNGHPDCGFCETRMREIIRLNR